MDYLTYMYYELMKLSYIFSLKLKSEIEKIIFFFKKKKNPKDVSETLLLVETKN